MDRIEYMKCEHGVIRQVICDRSDAGQESFAEKELGDVRWYPLRPSQVEQCVVAQIREIAAKPDGPLLFLTGTLYIEWHR